MKWPLTILLPLTAFISIEGCANTEQRNDPDASDTTLVPPRLGTINDTATFAAGCFWCVEAIFERVKGVVEVVSGYSGGDELNPTYKQVGSGQTGHAEAVQVYFDSNIVSFTTLIDVFFHTHDPTQADGQHPDYGRQYRSAIFYHDARQKEEIDSMIAAFTASAEFNKPIVTEVSSFKFFAQAEVYHQDYYRRNPRDSYVQQWTIPKVNKYKKLYPELYMELPSISGK